MLMDIVTHMNPRHMKLQKRVSAQHVSWQLQKAQNSCAAACAKVGLI